MPKGLRSTTFTSRNPGDQVDIEEVEVVEDEEGEVEVLEEEEEVVEGAGMEVVEVIGTRTKRVERRNIIWVNIGMTRW